MSKAQQIGYQTRGDIKVKGATIYQNIGFATAHTPEYIAMHANGNMFKVSITKYTPFDEDHYKIRRVQKLEYTDFTPPSGKSSIAVVTMSERDIQRNSRQQVSRAEELAEIQKNRYETTKNQAEQLKARKEKVQENLLDARKARVQENLSNRREERLEARRERVQENLLNSRRERVLQRREQQNNNPYSFGR